MYADIFCIRPPHLFTMSLTGLVSLCIMGSIYTLGILGDLFYRIFYTLSSIILKLVVCLIIWRISKLFFVGSSSTGL